MKFLLWCACSVLAAFAAKNFRNFAQTGAEPLLDTALKLRDMALKDEYFVKRKLAPNVDFFSGLIYRAMGFPTDM